VVGDGSAPPRRRGSIVWPVLLIAVGSIFLLQNLGILPWDAWRQIWRLWPLVLVLVGVELLFGGRVRGAPLVVLVLALLGGGVVLLSTIPVARIAASPWETRTFEQPLQGATQADIRVEFGAGRLEVGALPAGGDKLSTATYEGPAELLPREPRASVSNGRAEVRYTLGNGDRGPINLLPLLSGERRSPSLSVALAPGVQQNLRITAGASEARVDLSKLRVSQLDLETGASTTWLRLPEAAGTTTAQVQAGAAQVEIELPEGVAAQVRYEGGLSALHVENPRLVREGGDGRYRTADYETNPNKVELRIETGASTVTVR
jgi:hypothetical protein